MPLVQRRLFAGRGGPARLVKRSRGPLESESQSALFTWAGLMCRQYPELRWMYAIPNGSWYGMDRKLAVQIGRRLAAQGLKPGVLDVCLPAARGGYNALYVEMKAGDNDTSKEQDEWVEGLHSLGNLCVICWGFEAARIAIVNYLEGNLRKP
jgi:hypothetical protein